MTNIIRLDFTPVKKEAIAAFKLAGQDVSAAFRSALTTESWSWPEGRKTKRYGGAVGDRKRPKGTKGKRKKRTVKEIAGSPRNRVDSGGLAGSQKGPKFSKNELTWTWSKSYAAAVYRGYVKGGTIVPGTPWCRAVLIGDVSNYRGQTLNFTEVYADNLKLLR